MPRGIRTQNKNYFCIDSRGKTQGPFKDLQELKDHPQMQNIPEGSEAPLVLREVGRLEVRQRVALARR